MLKVSLETAFRINKALKGHTGKVSIDKQFDKKQN